MCIYVGTPHIYLLLCGRVLGLHKREGTYDNSLIASNYTLNCSEQ